MNPPFLDLAYYVGAERVDACLRAIRSETSHQTIIGLAHRPEAVVSLGASVAVRTEGEDFCGPLRADDGHLRMQGKLVSAAFLRVAGLIDCAYGAILIEYRLETPEELRRDPRSLAFRDFYLSRRRLSADLISRSIALVPQEAYVLDLEHGIYVSMSPEYNPDARGVESNTAQTVSARIGEVIARAGD